MPQVSVHVEFEGLEELKNLLDEAKIHSEALQETVKRINEARVQVVVNKRV